MGQALVGWFVLTIGVGSLVRRTVIHLRGCHRPWHWKGRCVMGPAAEYAICVFLICGGLICLTESVFWFGIGVIAWLVGYLAERADWGRFQGQEDALRKANAAYHPGIFEQPPPQDINAVGDKEFRLFDAAACRYLGNVPRQDLQKLIEAQRGLAYVTGGRRVRSGTPRRAIRPGRWCPPRLAQPALAAETSLRLGIIIVSP